MLITEDMPLYDEVVKNWLEQLRSQGIGITLDELKTKIKAMHLVPASHLAPTSAIGQKYVN